MGLLILLHRSIQFEKDFIYKRDAEENGKVTNLHEMKGELMMFFIANHDGIIIPDEECKERSKNTEESTTNFEHCCEF